LLKAATSASASREYHKDACRPAGRQHSFAHALILCREPIHFAFAVRENRTRWLVLRQVAQGSTLKTYRRRSDAIADAACPKVVIGSYPFFDPQHGPNTNVVLRARDAQKLALAKRAVEDMLERVRGAQSRSG
jgi:hypothetical protein